MSENPLPKPDEIYAPEVLDVEQLFAAEYRLRVAAKAYSDSTNEGTRKGLREAAQYYARVVEFFEGKD